MKLWWRGADKLLRLRHGELGERAAKRHLKQNG